MDQDDIITLADRGVAAVEQRESSRSPKKRDALRDSLRDSLRAGVLRPVDPMAKVEAELARLRSDLAAMASRVEDLGGLVAAAAGRPRPSGGPGAAAPSPEEERLRSFRTSEAAVESALVSFEPPVLEDLRRRESVAEAPPEPEPAAGAEETKTAEPPSDDGALPEDDDDEEPQTLAMARPSVLKRELNQGRASVRGALAKQELLWQMSSDAARLKELESRWLVRYGSLFHTFWGQSINVSSALVFVMSTITFNHVWRDRIGTEFRDNPGWHGTELMLELVFLLDIVLNFNTTFFEELSGKEVFDRRRISVNYLLNHHHKVYAPLDVLASVPFLVETVCGFTGATMDHSITYFKFFKLWRLGRVVRQFGTMNNRAARALYLFVSFLLINHLMACAYFWMVVRRAPYYGGDETWDGRPSDPMQGEAFGRFFPPEGIADVALQRQYLYAYWFVIMLSAGDNPEPTANDQFAFTLSSYLIGLIFNAIIIAEVTSFFATMMDNTGRIQREQMDHVVQTLRYKRVPAKVIHEVRSYLNFQWQTRQGMDAQDVCDLLPRHLARKVQMTLVVTGYAADIPMFSILNQTMKLKLIEHLERHVVAPKETVFKQGEAATSMFWLVRGSMTIWRRDKPGDEPVVLSKLIPGQSSGEAGLFSRDACHDTSAVADGGAWCELAVLSAASLCELIAEDHSILHWLTLSAQKVQRSIADRVHAQAKAQAHRLSVASIDVAQLAALQPKAGSFAKLEHMADPLKAFLESAEHKLLDREEQLAAFVDDHVQQLRRRLHHAFGSDDGTEAVRKDLVAEVQQATSAETFAKGLSSNDEDGALEDTAILHEIVERVEETTDRSDRLRRRDSELKQKLMAVNAFSGGRSFREERTLGAIDHATLSAKAKVHAAAGAVNAFKSHRAAAYEEETEHAKALDAFQRATSRVRSSNYESSKGLHRLTTKDAGLKFRRSVASVGKAAVLAKRSAGGSLRKVRYSLPKVRASVKVRDSLRGADDRGADALPRDAPKD